MVTDCPNTGAAKSVNRDGPSEAPQVFRRPLSGTWNELRKGVSLHDSRLFMLGHPCCCTCLGASDLLDPARSRLDLRREGRQRLMVSQMQGGFALATGGLTLEPLTLKPGENKQNRNSGGSLQTAAHAEQRSPPRSSCH